MPMPIGPADDNRRALAFSAPRKRKGGRDEYSTSPPLTATQVMSATHLAEDEKDHLLDVLAKAAADGAYITHDDADTELREHEYCKHVVRMLDVTGDGILTAENIETASHLPDDEREHLTEALQRREALGAGLTAEEAHEALEEHREVRRLMQALDTDGDGELSEADVCNPEVLVSADARQHILETLRKARARGLATLSIDEAHSALEEHREVVAIVHAIDSGEGRLTEHNIVAADGISEDEREHLLETLGRIKQSGRELTVDLAHKALEEHREVVAIITAIDAGGDGRISAHNVVAADVPAAVRGCLTRALEASAGRGAQLTTHEAHHVLEMCRSEWSDGDHGVAAVSQWQ